MDQRTTVQELKRLVMEFREERDWKKYDTPRNLAVSISIEAAELLEHFQWDTDEEMGQMTGKKQAMDEVSDELADVIIYCLGFSDVMGIDVSRALKRKLEKNREKYPVRGLDHTQVQLRIPTGLRWNRLDSNLVHWKIAVNPMVHHGFTITCEHYLWA